MGHEDRICIAVLDRESSSSKRLIESASHTPTISFASISSLIDAPPADDISAIFVDAEYLGQNVLAEDLHRVKDKWSTIPLIVLTEDKNPEHIADFFRFGFDEFILKPLNGNDLSIRLEVKKIQIGKEKERIVTVGEVSVDPTTRSIKNLTNGKVKYLSPIEVNLLSILLSSMGQSISRENVKKKCWGNTNVSDNALNRKLFEVRRALSQIGSDLTIKTLYGSGYAIQKKRASTED